MPAIRIGTRDSQLALWQAQFVKDSLQEYHTESILIPVKTEGDMDMSTPLYAMGVQGVFTRSLDVALLNGTIDIAVHSMKDVPVQLPKGIVQVAVLKRASHKDIFVVNERTAPAHTNDATAWDEYFKTNELIIATSSIRRKAQWLAKYPHHRIDNLRGNVNTRLRKLQESEWAGAIFAAAGLERIGLRPVSSFDLDWMLPAPAQGAIMIVAHEENAVAIDACKKLNHPPTAMATKAERDFLNALMGGCSTPISAYCEATESTMRFHGSVTRTDGSDTVEVRMESSSGNYDELGNLAATEIKQKGAAALLDKN